MEKTRDTGKTVFERNPRKTLVVTAALLIVAADVLAGAVAGSSDQSFRCSSPYYHHDFLPNQNTGTSWGDRRYSMFTNSLGFRDREVREVPLTAARKRILLIGDSFIEGMGVEYRDSMAGILEESLKTRGIEVLNAAAVSYSPKLYYLKVRHLIEQKRLTFDELYVFVDISDPHDEIIYKYWEPKHETALSSARRLLDRFLQKRSFLYGFLAARRRAGREKAISNVFPAEGSADARFWIQDLKEYLRRAEPEKDRFLWPNKQSALEEWGREGLSLCARHLAELQYLCSRHGVRMTLAVYPSPYQLTAGNLSGIPVTYWREFAKDRGIGFIDLFPVFIGSEPPETVYARYFIRGDTHWNEAGNRLVADAVLQHIRKSSP